MGASIVAPVNPLGQGEPPGWPDSASGGPFRPSLDQQLAGRVRQSDDAEVDFAVADSPQQIRRLVFPQQDAERRTGFTQRLEKTRQKERRDGRDGAEANVAGQRIALGCRVTGKITGGREHAFGAFENRPSDHGKQHALAIALEEFAGESMAHIKYRYFARICRAHGDEDTAKVFEATADQEVEHAMGHLDLLYPKAELSPAKCLEFAIAGETYEYTEMYPGFRHLAEQEGHEYPAQIAESKQHAERFRQTLAKAAKRFVALAKVEERHARRYQETLAKVTA